MNTSTLFQKSKTINISGELYSLSSPKVMGILNITDDSFYDGGKYTTHIKQLARVEKMLSDGANFIDIGAQSTRPGSKELGIKHEIESLIPTIINIRKEFPNAIISIDTWHAEVAKECYNNGAHIINDISGGTFDNNMLDVISEINIPYIIMHTGGKPDIMQQNPKYDNVVKEVLYFMSEQRAKLNLKGVNDIIYDPGFGFGKNIEHNYELLKQLKTFEFLQGPILVGISRKSMLYKPLGINATEALNATTSAHMIALQNGADILRVHDVKEAKETIDIYKLMEKA
ncbi:MAG: dihydropteroate synthase [Bacteroidales bacterium]|nr:dihydropteroate synthase [Bacteroidales bacterium]